MTNEIRLLLCFQSSDQSQIDLALEYWSMNSAGTWKSTVQEIADRAGQRKHKIPQLVYQAAVAYDLSLRCIDCHAPKQLYSRSEIASGSCYLAEYLCANCRLARLEEERRAKDEEARVEHERIAGIIKAVANEHLVCDYATISYFDAVVAYGVMLFSNSAIENGMIGNPYDLPLCPRNSLLFTLLGRLYNDGVLVFRSDTPIDAIDPKSLDNNQFSYYPSAVNWQFANGKNGESFRTIFDHIGRLIDKRTEHPGYRAAVAELWWILGFDDSLRCLDEQLSSYRLSGFKSGEKMREAIYYALKRFSIPKLRYLLWRVAKNAAALSIRRDFTTSHALNTIPGSLIRDCDRALADGWTINPYCMKWDEEEAGLVTILFDRVLETGMAGFKSMTGAAFEEILA